MFAIFCVSNFDFFRNYLVGSCEPRTQVVKNLDELPLLHLTDDQQQLQNTNFRHKYVTHHTLAISGFSFIPIFETTNAADDLSDDSESGKIGFLACSCFSCPFFPLCLTQQKQKSGKQTKKPPTSNPPVMSTPLLFVQAESNCSILFTL